MMWFDQYGLILGEEIMNKIYKLVWNARRQAYVVASEKSQSKGRLFLINLLSVAGLTLAITPASYAQYENSPFNNLFTQNVTYQLTNNDFVSNSINPFFNISTFSHSIELNIPDHEIGRAHV